MKTLTIVILLTAGYFALGGELGDYHLKQIEGKPRPIGRPFSFRPAVSHNISEIGIERTVCRGPCPSYTFVAKSDGSFRYVGDKYVPRLGAATGTISSDQFDQLARFIRDSSFMDLDDSYSALVTDLPTVYTMVVMDGKRKVVSDYANSGPIKLWAIEQLIDDLMAKATWSGLTNTPAKTK